MQKREIKKIIEKENLAFIYLQFSDLFGQVKTIVIPASLWEKVLEEGIWFDGSSIEGFARISESDMRLRPDPQTFAVLPWSEPERKAGRFICNIYNSKDRRLPADPRFILEKAISQAKKLGYHYLVGAEFEFYLFERSFLPQLQPHDNKSYFDYTPHSRASAICEKVIQALLSFGIKAEAHHHEVGPGQHEIDLHYDEALKTADNIMTLKMTLKAFTGQSDLKAVWMAKPIKGLPGNGLHIHQSLWKKGKNLFYQKNGQYQLSSLALNFLAGQLTHAKALSALVSPTVNSYKRLVSGFEAPVYICWGQTNRSSLIRIPQNIPQKAKISTRLEYRAPDPTANPYLALAGLLSAGLEGIKRKISPPPPVEENVYEFDFHELLRNKIDLLPESLREAINALKEDQLILEVLGRAKNRYLEIKEREWKEFLVEVTDWEKERYL
ncbi:MAG: type I glutamate--ammonia ligase [Microgenomates group bacterium]